MFPDSLGSGDDDEDNGLDDSSAEVENDQVYFSRGLLLASLRCHISWGLRDSSGYSDASFSTQVPTGPTPNAWRRSCMQFLRGTPSSFVVQPWAAPCQASAGSKMDGSSGESIALAASRWGDLFLVRSLFVCPRASLIHTEDVLCFLD